MLAYRNPSNEDSDSIFNYTLKLDAYHVSAKVIAVTIDTLLKNLFILMLHSFCFNTIYKLF